MAHFDDNMYPVTRITAGAIGDLGRRVFVLQAHYGDEAVAWVIHKEQAIGLSRAIPQLLASVQTEFPELAEPLVAAEPNLTLREPLYPRFRVGSLGLGYDRVHDLVVLSLLDASAEPDADGDAFEAETPAETYVYTTRGQALLLSRHVESVVTAGRPLCPACGEPVDDFGHFCLPSLSQRKVGGVYLQ